MNMNGQKHWYQVWKVSVLYYKHVTIVNDDSSVGSKWSFKLIDDPSIVIYDCHRFIIQATVCEKIEFFFSKQNIFSCLSSIIIAINKTKKLNQSLLNVSLFC